MPHPLFDNMYILSTPTSPIDWEVDYSCSEIIYGTVVFHMKSPLSVYHALFISLSYYIPVPINGMTFITGSSYG